jgi:hypothetical protein
MLAVLVIKREALMQRLFYQKDKLPLQADGRDWFIFKAASAYF